LPTITVALLDVARFVDHWAGVLIIPVLLVLLAWAALMLTRLFDPHGEHDFLRDTRDRVAWRLPLAHSLVRDRGLAAAFDLIAEALRAGLPIDRAIAEASRLRVNIVLRERLSSWADELRGGGATIHDAARTSKLPPLVVQLLAPVRGGPDALADALDFLARYYDSRFSRTRILLEATSVPVTVFIFAAVVAWVALAMMLPLMSLINYLSSSVSVGWR
jgi:general secretion pathway protein F